MLSLSPLSLSLRLPGPQLVKLADRKGFWDGWRRAGGWDGVGVREKEFGRGGGTQSSQYSQTAMKILRGSKEQECSGVAVFFFLFFFYTCEMHKSYKNTPTCLFGDDVEMPRCHFLSPQPLLYVDLWLCERVCVSVWNCVPFLYSATLRGEFKKKASFKHEVLNILLVFFWTSDFHITDSDHMTTTEELQSQGLVENKWA